MPPVNLVGPYGTETVPMMTERDSAITVGIATLRNTVPDLTGFGVTSNLTATSTFAQDSVITMGTGAGEIDPDLDAVLELVVPGSWVTGANNGGLFFNSGGFNGAVGIIDDDARLFAGTTAGADLISVAGAVSPGDTVVLQYARSQVMKAWINGSPVHGTALQEAASGTIAAAPTAWTGENAGGYISRTAGTVTNGQQSTNTDLALFSSWVAHGTLGTLQAPIGTWGDMTYYKDQTV